MDAIDGLGPSRPRGPGRCLRRHWGRDRPPVGRPAGPPTRLQAMGEAPGTHRRAEAVGELRYLSIRLQEYVVALPARSLPPRGRVPWSPDELAMLRALAYQLSAGGR